MSINLSKESTRIIVDSLVLLQQKRSVEFSKALAKYKNSNDIAVCIVKDNLLDVSNLIGIFSEGL